MKLSAQDAARTIWIAAVAIVVLQVVATDFPWWFYPNWQGSTSMDWRLFFLTLATASAYAANLAALGVVIYLLGEIRDRLPKL